MDYKFSKKDRERIDRQVNDIAHGNESWKGFKKGCADILANREKCYKEYFAYRECEITCATLVTAGICGSNNECTDCIVKQEFENALKEIRSGLRGPVKVYRGCKTFVDVKKDGSIRITQVLR